VAEENRVPRSTGVPSGVWRSPPTTPESLFSEQLETHSAQFVRSLCLAARDFLKVKMTKKRDSKGETEPGASSFLPSQQALRRRCDEASGAFCQLLGTHDEETMWSRMG